METSAALNSEKGPVAGPVADLRQAWLRLAATMLVSTIGGVGMWSVVVALPAVQAEFGVPRAEASLPFTLAMLGFALGGVVMGRLLDRCRNFGAARSSARWRLASAISAQPAPAALSCSRWRMALIGFGTR